VRTQSLENRTAPPHAHGEDGHSLSGPGADGAGGAHEAGPATAALDGLIRDERGVRFAPEADD
jgi:hypothetical protein